MMILVIQFWDVYTNELAREHHHKPVQTRAKKILTTSTKWCTKQNGKLLFKT